MHIANLSGRAALLVDDGTATTAVDIAEASGGRFGPAPRSIYENWEAFAAWAEDAELAPGRVFEEHELGAPVPDPRQIFAIGLNYRDHADEANLAYPDDLVVFTKFASSLAGPNVTVELPSATVDWETELVVVISKEIHDADTATARDSIAGYAVGQDFSERSVQLRGPAPQFSLGKSFPNFAPFGPGVVTLDELEEGTGLRITATLDRPGAPDGESVVLQDGTTADLIFSVERIVSDLSRIVTLYPGDVIFTGTPAGVGHPQGRYLQPGDTLTSTIHGVGTMTNRFVSAGTAL